MKYQFESKSPVDINTALLALILVKLGLLYWALGIIAAGCLIALLLKENNNE